MDAARCGLIDPARERRRSVSFELIDSSITFDVGHWPGHRCRIKTGSILVFTQESQQEGHVAKRIAQAELRELALVGARARLMTLRTEIASLVRLFPELGRGSLVKGADLGVTKRRKKPGRKHPMSAAERKAVSERMRKYWAERRAAKAKK
jgi:hypothetical protein